jgi:hypothetical protein
MTQEDYLTRISKDPEFCNTPLEILTAAFQPTARGGPRHFVTGNIRILNTARSLLSEDIREEITNSDWLAAHLAENSRTQMVGNDWLVWIGYQHGIGKTLPSMNSCEEEVLIVGSQILYHCPICNTEALI